MMEPRENIKMVIVGDGGCGKTVLLWCYIGNEFDEKHIPTVLDIYHAKVNVNESKFKIEVHDTAGQEELNEIRNLTYPDTDVVIMCYSSVALESLQNVRSFWIPETRRALPNVPFILVGNKIDLKEKVNPLEHVSMENGDRVLRENRGSYHAQCSAKAECLGAKTKKVQEIFRQALVAHFIDIPPAIKRSSNKSCIKCSLL